MRLTLLLLLFVAGCTTAKNGLFGKKSPHDVYGTKLSDANLDKTTLGRIWFMASEKAIREPLQISLPYKEAGYFSPDQPHAAGFTFSAKRGQKITIRITSTPARGVLYFVDLWEVDNTNLKLVTSADTSTANIEYEIGKDTRLLLRLQPELLNSLGYTITITTAASLAFPVRKSDNPKIISFWGNSRDAGARRHEGIDIAAKKRTPAVACADGHVTNVSANNLGGKVVFMRPDGKNYSLYYAHLDEQLVRSGQRVSTGDVLGLIGNTGNAATTVPHLHFGIYTTGGAIDPFNFVNPEVSQPKAITADQQKINSFVRLLKDVQPKDGRTAIKKNDLVKVLAASGDSYKIETPEGLTGMVNDQNLTIKPIQTIRLKTDKLLTDVPSGNAAVKKILSAGTEATLLGSFNSYQYVKVGEMEGWIN